MLSGVKFLPDDFLGRTESSPLTTSHCPFPCPTTPANANSFKTPSSTSTSQQHNVVPLVEAMQHMAFSARDLARAADIYDRMLRDKECGVILCLAGSLISAGLKKVFVDMIRNNMVDAIVSTGANIVDQDFFEALGFRHYIADEQLKSGMDDGELRDHAHRPHLRHADRRGRAARSATRRRKKIADELPPRPLLLARVHPARWASTWTSNGQDARLDRLRGLQARRADLLPGVHRLLGRLRPGGPPARARRPAASVELRQRQGLLRADAAQDQQPDDRPVHDRRRRAEELHPGHRRRGRDPRATTPRCTSTRCRSPSPTSATAPSPARTLKEASSWGKVDTVYEQMVFSEATLAVPLIVGYAYHKGGWKQRQESSSPGSTPRRSRRLDRCGCRYLGGASFNVTPFIFSAVSSAVRLVFSGLMSAVMSPSLKLAVARSTPSIL